MQLKEFFLEQLDREAEASRKVLERVPEGQNRWKPHERSMELGYLAALVATMPGSVDLMITRDELNLDGAPGETFRTKEVETRAELLSLPSAALEKSRAALESTTDEQLMKPWRLTLKGQVLDSGPRYAKIADGALSHMAHHGAS